MDSSLDLQIGEFYQRWHALEGTMGARAGLVIDFDMAPRIPMVGKHPYSSRKEAIDVCEGLLAELAPFAPGGPLAGDAAGPRNYAYTTAKLQGSLAYLWALMGERRPFSPYLQATMGIVPRRVPAEEWSLRLSEAVSQLADAGVPWSPDGRERMRQAFGRSNMDGFGDELRAAAVDLVARLREILPTLPDPEYVIEDVDVDAYWSNWINGSVEGGVKLQVNTHARIDYQKVSAVSLAAHEIAGHAAHVATLRQSVDRGIVDPSSLNLTVHACDAFQMEGLAQVVLHVLSSLSDEPLLVGDHVVLEALRGVSGDRLGNAQLDVEAGAPLSEVWTGVARDMPLSGALSVHASLRDRSLDPLHRAYIHVYAPSRRMFLRALDLPRAARVSFIQAMYEELWTPGQIALLLDGMSRDEVRNRVPAPVAP